jgi:hypothetical protein
VEESGVDERLIKVEHMESERHSSSSEYDQDKIRSVAGFANNKMKRWVTYKLNFMIRGATLSDTPLSPCVYIMSSQSVELHYELLSLLLLLWIVIEVGGAAKYVIVRDNGFQMLNLAFWRF